MKLKNNLYSITSRQQNDNAIGFSIRLNTDCVIYKAHFPEQPVTPGVCIVEIAHELAEEMLGQTLDVKVVKNVKFLSVISPLEVQDITYNLSSKEDADGTIKVQASVVSDETVYAKITMVLRVMHNA